MIPKCAVRGCDNEADPRYWAHAPDGTGVMVCDGHEGTPCKGTTVENCTCPTRMFRLATLKQTGWGCPSAWQGTGSKDEFVYIRYRYGQLSMVVEGQTVKEIDHGDGLDGIMSTEEMMRLLNLEVEYIEFDE